MIEKPYIDEKLNNNIFLRTFKCDVLTEELVWHRDEKSRFIEVLEGSGWEFQLENNLPKQIIKGDRFFIPAKTYHRIKRGIDNLTVKIEEL